MEATRNDEYTIGSGIRSTSVMDEPTSDAEFAADAVDEVDFLFVAIIFFYFFVDSTR